MIVLDPQLSTYENNGIKQQNSEARNFRVFDSAIAMTPLPSPPRGRSYMLFKLDIELKPNTLSAQKRIQLHAISFRRGANRHAD